jgi:23S rRNA (uracil1939-C5)-methyltransferase
MARFFKPQKRKVTNHRHQEVAIQRLDHQGAGIGHLNGKLVFVDGALPDEQALVQVTDEKKDHQRAKLIQCLTTSSERVPAVCAHYGRCGGCQLQHLSHDGQILTKEASLKSLIEKFAKIGNWENATWADPIVDSPFGYRRCARLALRVEHGQLQMGFREKQSQRILPITECPVLDEKLQALLTPLHALLSSLNQTERLGHVELVAADNGCVVLLRHLGKLSTKDEQKIAAFSQQENVIFYLEPNSGEVVRMHGDEPYYVVDGLRFAFSPKDFIQINRNVNAMMIAQAIDWLALSEDDCVLDLFCGLGNFSLPLAKRVAQVVGVEGIDDMVSRASQNAMANGIDNATFYQANLDESFVHQPWAKTAFNKVLLDPARGGASGVMSHIVELSPSHVVYVGCDPVTLARDAHILLQKGYDLTRVGILDMFPQTGHLESMALFTKGV